MPETIGQRLRQAREQRNLSLEKVSESTRIRLHYLQALEADDYSLIPSAAQARGFLHNYATFLSLDLGQALADVQRSRPQPSQEVSGPLSKVDLLPDEEKTALAPVESGPVTPPVRTSRLAGLRKTLDAPEADSASVQTQSGFTRREANAQPESPAGFPRTRHAESPPDAAAPRGFKKAILQPDINNTQPATERATRAESAALGIEAQRAEAESLPKAGDQPEVPNEAQSQAAISNLWSRFTSLFRLRFTKKETSFQRGMTASEPDSVSRTAPVPTSAKPSETPEEIFAEIGAGLHKRRELLSLTLEEVERHIHVRAAFIKALEAGAFDKLTSAVQTRGMLVNYATFLDLDTESILLRFADAIQAGHRLRYPEKPGGTKSPMRVSPNLPPLRSFIAGDLIFGVSVLALLVTMAVWGVNRIFATQAERATLPTAPSISDVLATSRAPTLEQQVTLIPAADTPFPAEGLSSPEATPGAPPDVSISVQVNITVLERTFLRVIVDGEEALNGRVLSGATYTYEAADSVEVLTGNAAALRITYNSRDLGLMGNFGEVVYRIYTADGIVTPTPAAPATFTATPNFTPTPSPTPSATPKSSSPTPGGG